MTPVRFTANLRHWNPEKGSGLVVADIPDEHVDNLGGLKQQRVSGTIGETEFSSNVMPAGGGRLAMSVSKAIMGAAGVGVGDEVQVEISAVGK